MEIKTRRRETKKQTLAQWHSVSMGFQKGFQKRHKEDLEGGQGWHKGLLSKGMSREDVAEMKLYLCREVDKLINQLSCCSGA